MMKEKMIKDEKEESLFEIKPDYQSSSKHPETAVVSLPPIKGENLDPKKFQHGKVQFVSEKYLLPYVKLKRNFQIEQAIKGLSTVKCETKDYKSNITDDLEKCKEHQTKSPEVTQTQNASPQTVVMFVCNDCNECFQEKQYLEGHACSKTMKRFNSVVNFKNRPDRSFVKKYKYICKSCDKSFPRKDRLIRHKLRCKIDLFYCDICKRPFLCKKTLAHHCREHLRLTSNQPIPCDHCNLVFKTKTEFTTHMFSVNGGGSFVCDHCNKSYKTKACLREHFKRTHTEVNELHTCDQCSKSLSSKKVLAIHKLTVHSVLRPIKCHECGDTFKRRKCLTLHSKIHALEKSYVCSFCSKKFTQRPHLVRHERLHTGVKPYVCDVCNKSFRDSSNFKVHQRNHTGERPYKCDQCQKSFKQSSHLTYHKKYHSDERTLSCGVCNKSFKERLSLTSHILLHSKIKPFNCKDCGKSFVQRTPFKRHKCW